MQNLHFRGHQSRFGNGRARRGEARPVEIEHRGRAHGGLVQVARHFGDAERPVAGQRGGVEGAHQVREAQQRLADAAPAGLLAGGGVAGFGVEQHGPDDGLHVTPHAVAIVVEGACYTLDIGGRGVAGDQSLDHLSPEEGADVGVVEQRIQRHGDVAHGAAGAGGNGLAQKTFFQRGMVLVVGDHRAHLGILQRIQTGRGAEEAAVRAGVATPAQAGEHPCQPHHVIIAVGGNGAAVAVLFDAAVGVELFEADGEELHHLARIVLVRGLREFTGRVVAFLLVADVGEIHAHHRVQGHVLQQLAKIAEGVAGQHVVIAGHPLRIMAGIATGRHHEDLGQRIRNALAQLVVLGGGVPPGVVGVLQLAVVATACLPGVHDVHQRGAALAELLFDPGIGGAAGEGGDVAGRGAEAGLGEEAAGFPAAAQRPVGVGDAAAGDGFLDIAAVVAGRAVAGVVARPDIGLMATGIGAAGRGCGGAARTRAQRVHGWLRAVLAVRPGRALGAGGGCRVASSTATAGGQQQGHGGGQQGLAADGQTGKAAHHRVLVAGEESPCAGKRKGTKC